MNEGRVVSQYGELAPSNDPMVVAAQLPSVEIREMLADGSEVRQTLADEDVKSAASVQDQITKRFVSDADIGPRLVRATGKKPRDIRFLDVAQALAAFIRHEFRMRPTRFQRFVFDDGPITQSELNGGILFYGRGRCIACHNGPYFSDFRFHAVAFPQAGFGKNGFGIDEGRYNVTLDPKDRFLFRTPPLFNVARTGPYSHSGSVNRLEAAIIAHFDPLRLIRTESMNAQARIDLLRRLGAAGKETIPASLSDEEVRDLRAFLESLSFSNP
jgi:cytochrome c peroxidase